MTIQSPIVLASGFFSQLFPGDTVPGTDTTAQASGNAALVLAGTALASGNAGISTGLTALASGNAGISTGLTALASGNAGISTGLTALASGNAGISTGLTALASGNAALVLANNALASGNAAVVLANNALASGNAAVVLASTALASGNAGLVSASNKVPISGGTMTGVLAVTSGTNALPGITFTGDPNTGFWSPTADTIAASTGGAERIRVDSSGNLKFNSGYGSAATAYGCRAWVNFNGTGTVAIRSSGNVSSITDNGTGDYTVNFTTALVDVNYSAQFTNGFVSNANVPATSNFVVGSIKVRCYNANDIIEDASVVCGAIFR